MPAARVTLVNAAAPVVVEEHVRLALEPLRAARDVHRHEAAPRGLSPLRDRPLVERHVVRDVEVHVAVAVVVAERAACAPPGVRDAGLPRDVGERPVAAVPVERVPSHRARHIHVVEAVVVVVGDADAHAPAAAREAAAGRDVGELAVAVVPVQRGQRVAAGLRTLARGTVDDEEVEVAVVVVVEPGGAAADLVDDVVLGWSAADVQERDAGLRRDVHEFERDVRRAGRGGEGEKKGERGRRARPSRALEVELPADLEQAAVDDALRRAPHRERGCSPG